MKALGDAARCVLLRGGGIAADFPSESYLVFLAMPRADYGCAQVPVYGRIAEFVRGHAEVTASSSPRPVGNIANNHDRISPITLLPLVQSCSYA